MNTQKIAELLRQLADEFESSQEAKTPEAKFSSFIEIPKLSAKAQKEVNAWKKKGFDKMVVMPSVSGQKANLDWYCKLADKNEQLGYDSDAWFESSVKESEIKNRPKGSYLLLYQSGDIPSETRGKNPDELDKLFKKNNWQGLTLPEYLLLQRLEVENSGDHSWSAYNYDSSKSNWTWLLGNTVGADKVVYAYWYPDLRQVWAYWRGRGDSSGGLGARPVVVVPL